MKHKVKIKILIEKEHEFDSSEYDNLSISEIMKKAKEYFNEYPESYTLMLMEYTNKISMEIKEIK